MRLKLRELRAIIQRGLVIGLREDLFTRGMYVAPTSTGAAREQLVDLTTNPDDEDQLAPHLMYSEEDPEDFYGPVPPGNPDEMEAMSVGNDPYVRDWAAINAVGVSR